MLTTKHWLPALLFFLIGLQQLPLYAQAGLRDSVARHTGYTGITAEAFGSLELGYAYGFKLWQQPTQLYTSLELPVFLWALQPAFEPLGWNLGIRQRSVRRGRFLLISDLGLTVRYHRQVTGRSIPFQLGIQLLPAFTLKRGYISLVAGYDQTLFTHIRHSDYSRDRFSGILNRNGQAISQRPQDGFYLGTGNTAHIGLAGLLRFKRSAFNWEIAYQDFLSPLTAGFDSMMFGQVPVRLTLRYARVLSD